MAVAQEPIRAVQISVEGLKDDVAALSSIDRRATRPGERRSAQWVAQRLREIGAENVEVAEARAVTSWAWTLIAHAVPGLIAAFSANRDFARLASLASIASYEADYTGRSMWLRRFLPSGLTTNVTARIPASGVRRQTVVLVAHHDAAHTGWIFHPRSLALYRGIAKRFGSAPPYSTQFSLSLAAAGGRSRLGRRVGLAGLVSMIALALQAAFSRTAPGANDNATGVAALLEIARQLRQTQLPGLELILVSPGAEEVGVDGMSAWVREHGGELDPHSTLVVGLDSLGGGEPVIVKRESWTARYRSRDLDWADRGATRAGQNAPKRVAMPVNTDPMLARHSGLPALSLLAMTDGWLGKFHQLDDVPENVDWDSVQRCLGLALGIVTAFAEGDEQVR